MSSSRGTVRTTGTTRADREAQAGPSSEKDEVQKRHKRMEEEEYTCTREWTQVGCDCKLRKNRRKRRRIGERGRKEDNIAIFRSPTESRSAILSWARAKHRSQLLLQHCMVGQRSSHACLVPRRRRWWWWMWPRIKANRSRSTHKANSPPSPTRAKATSCGQHGRRTAANACAIIRIARVFKAEHLVVVSTSLRPIQTSWAT